MGVLTPNQNQPTFNFSGAVINPMGIPIPKGFLTPSENGPKF